MGTGCITEESVANRKLNTITNSCLKGNLQAWKPCLPGADVQRESGTSWSLPAWSNWHVAFRAMLAASLLCLPSSHLLAIGPGDRTLLNLKPGDVLPTGNEWIALPDIREEDGALNTFNVLSMQHRGLLQVQGERNTPVLQPFFEANGQRLAFIHPSWSLIEYWIPTAHLTIQGMDATLTWCAPHGSRAAFLHMTLKNGGATAVPVTLGIKASWGELDRVTYNPVPLHGERIEGVAPWVDPAEVFSYVTNDTEFGWSLMYPGSQSRVISPPDTIAPELEARHTVTLQPGETAEADFVLGAGIEEFSAAHNVKALAEELFRYNADTLIDQEAAWCKRRTRTTGQPDLDLLMNRNFLFTEMYAWGKTIDTEQLVGITSRSPRYYVSAAYWDRDAMLWSFPALLDIDKPMARDALDYALTIQLRNTGTHSRFIDGVVLEDGFQLDEAVAPIVALGAYEKATNDVAFLRAHRDAVFALRDRVQGRLDPTTGLYSSLQDSQDEFQKLPYLTYDNVLTWRALLNLQTLLNILGETADASDMGHRAAALHAAILKVSVASGAPGASGPIFASATDGRQYVFTEIPPGPLMKLPSLGFIAATDPLFVRTYEWLHSGAYQYSYSTHPYGLPGSYRLQFTTSWEVADHLLLPQGRGKALKILRGSPWDGGIITEGVNPDTDLLDTAGRAFATAAGYMAHSICEAMCQDAATP